MTKLTKELHEKRLLFIAVLNQYEKINDSNNSNNPKTSSVLLSVLLLSFRSSNAEVS